jgi:hypothetical protein
MSREVRNDSSRLHPLAENLWRQLDGQSEADRRFVHNTLQRRLTPATQLENQQISVAALQRFNAARRLAGESLAEEEIPRWAKGTLSKRNYNSFRDTQPDRSMPSSTLISNAFGGRWGDALAAAGLAAAPNFLASRGLSLGKFFDDDEIRAVVRAWISRVDADDPDGPLIQAEFAAWAVGKKNSPQSSELRYPTLPTVKKYLGTWAEVLIDLGQLDRHPEVIAVRRMIEGSRRSGWAIETVESLDLDALPEPGVKNPEHAATWLRWMTKPLSMRERAALEMSQWAILRAALIDRLASLGVHAEIPSAKAIKSQVDDRSWPTAKARAGIVDRTCEAHCSPTTHAFDDDELVEALASARSALGRPPSQSHYNDHRRDEARSGRRLPSDATIRMRLGEGTWAGALERLAADRPEHPLEGKPE